ncbi:DUF2790 domain-containing protein [Pseudomonas oryzae]|uniref:DUF2790 domain-containing protein n=1 Tax=Pseudomonas oryzae TaxID=1392877 RepID=A0A1H1YGD9_9PSED|nr:DUF2790 domain-containing protein [Pseudomonas oryzae]SDT20086.1 Protein of unknown function [Pseudomonas oryzae]
MKIHFLLLALIAGPALAADPPEERYTYGMPLDIDRVITIEEPEDVCGVVTARMTYQDSQGEVRVLDYRKWSTGCGVTESNS